jgi:MinD-like ATPase involved in chromosome partitioning or flagellar assembly
MNMVDEGRHELTNYEVEQLVELPIISRIPRDREVLRSLSAKLPAVDISPKSRASREFSRLAAYLVGEEYRPPGILSGIFGRLRRTPRRRSLDFSIKTKPGIESPETQ